MGTLKHLRRLTGLAVVSLFAASVSVQACTSFLLRAKDGSPVYARTLEYAIDTSPSVVVVPRNYAYDKNTAGPQWRTHYAFVGVMNLGAPFVSDGMNEKGLAGGSLYFPDFAVYTPLDESNSSKIYAPWEFLSWVLSNFATVAEVKAGISGVKIVALKTPDPNVPFVLPYHFAIHDASGASIVIEPVDGKLNVYDNPLGVLTNSPPFDWHLKNIRNYLKLSSVPAAPIKIGNEDFKPFGMGSGMLGIPGDSTPPSRFIRAVAYTTTVQQLKDGPQTVELAEHILNNFDLPKGYVAADSPQDNPEYTQWSSIADLSARKYYIKSYQDQTLREVDLTKINLDEHNLLKSPLSSQQLIPPIIFSKP